MSLEKLKVPFWVNGELSRPLLILFLAINMVVYINVIIHPVEVGYDAGNHLLYVGELGNLRLPTRQATLEFFSPPLPYLIPGSVTFVCNLLGGSNCIIRGGNAGQLINILLSLGSTWLLLQIAYRFDKEIGWFRFLSLLLLGMLTVYYKTFAFLRGEPYIIFFALLGISITLQIIIEGLSLKHNIMLGTVFGCLIMSRQWGFFVNLALILCLTAALLGKREVDLKDLLQAYLVIGITSLLIGSWYYVYLFIEYGTFAAFNREATTFSFTNQPLKFYFSLPIDDLFSNPAREKFANQFIPIFYTDIWGDYWEYFLVNQKNRDEMLSYLGRVNMAGIVPTMLMLLSLGIGFRHSLNVSGSIKNKSIPDPVSIFLMVNFAIVMVSLIGYFWFLIKYPNYEKGDTIKATYMLHIFPSLSFLSAQLLLNLKKKSSSIFYIVLVTLTLILIYNARAFFSRY